MLVPGKICTGLLLLKVAIINSRNYYCGYIMVICVCALYCIGCSLHLIRDSSKEKPLEIEMGWMCEETNFEHSHVPKELVAAAEAQAKASLEGGAGAGAGAGAGSSASTEHKSAEMEV